MIEKGNNLLKLFMKKFMIKIKDGKNKEIIDSVELEEVNNFYIKYF